MQQPLTKPLRNRLESTVIKARDVAEGAAREALERLSIGDKSPGGHLSDEQRNLRNRLRAHGRQLGDIRKSDGSQGFEHLLVEVAYEHWHRMLFARFLAENNLLMYEDGQTPLSLQDCFDLAEEGGQDGWGLAARYAAAMLPQIFRHDSPVFELAFALEHQRALEKLLSGLEESTFHASDSLGWVYQYWQSKKKDEVNASGNKIGANELPAVTQLFTEPYMVSFLLDNSLGGWWAARHLSEADLKNASSEDELRSKASIPGVPLSYLRFVQQDNGTWTPAAGTFDDWPEHLSELKTLDPCCGSGHFLVAAFLMLVPMRMKRDGLSAQDAIDAVLRENLHGLELDQRCVELAAFTLALTAWIYPDAGGYRPLPELNLACSGLSVSVTKDEWRRFGLGTKNLTIALEWMHDAFSDAPVLGSLLNPAKTDAAKLVHWDELSSTLEQALHQEQSDEQQEAAVAAQGLAKAAVLLSRQYQWVITNVPYLARGKQSDRLRDFCEKHYPAAKNDLATVFLDRCLELCVEGGTSSVVLPQNWLFLTSYKKFREKLLKNDTWHMIARLGEGGFDSSAAAGAFVAMISLSRGNASGQHGELFGEIGNSNLTRGVDVSEPRTAAEKASRLLTIEIKSVEQAKQLENPDARIALEEASDLPRLEKHAECFAGVLNGDSPRFQKQFWEIVERSDLWTFQQTTVQEHKPFGGLELVLYYDKANGHLREEASIRRDKLHDSDQRGNKAWGHKGIGVSQMRVLPASIYTGETFDSNIAVIYPKDQSMVLPIWTYCQSVEYHDEVRRIDQKLNVTNATLVKVAFDLDYWTKVAEEKYPNGLPKPYSDDPTQWIFHGHPAQSDDPLQVIVARLLGYRWPAELDPEMELSDDAYTWIAKTETLISLVDDDGIVCLPAVRGEKTAADRLEDMLQAAYGSDWSANKRNQLLEAASCKNKGLDVWLHDKFFEQHCKLFHHRPFIWHVWDGLNDGFSALVNYHKLDKKNLERLVYTYLDDWTRTQTHQQAEGVDGADMRLQAAQNLKKRLEQILKGEAPYDIFVRWKPIEQQPIGWDPDINDGVRFNIRPFMTVEDVGTKGAGILRAKPNIHWKKDRGKDVGSVPWYKLGLEYGEGEGARINDHHLTLAEKEAAR